MSHFLFVLMLQTVHNNWHKRFWQNCALYTRLTSHSLTTTAEPFLLQNWVIVNVISNTCGFPAVTTQNVCCKKWRVFWYLTCVNDCWPRFNIYRSSSLFGAQSPHETISGQDTCSFTDLVTKHKQDSVEEKKLLLMVENEMRDKKSNKNT